MPSEPELGPGDRREATDARSRQVGTARSSAKNRGRLDTVAEMVNSCTGGSNKSRIMLTANVNSVVATELLNKLMASGLLTARREKGNSVVYYQTQEGTQFVRRYSDLVSMLCPGLVPQTKMNDLKGFETWI